jgi:hypothetical protein
MTSPRLKANPRGTFRRTFAGSLRIDLREGAMDRQRRSHRALGVVFLRDRVAEQGRQTIAQPFQDMPPSVVTARDASSKIGAYNVAPVLELPRQ